MFGVCVFMTANDSDRRFYGPSAAGHCCARGRRPLAAFSLIAVVGCGRLGKQPPATSPTIVTVSTPIEQEVTDFADFSGRTAAVESVEVRARVNGYLEKVNFKEGELVHKGDVLFEIDPRPYQAQVDIATGQIAAADAMVQRTQADDARAKALRASTPGAISQQDLINTKRPQIRRSPMPIRHEPR